MTQISYMNGRAQDYPGQYSQVNGNNHADGSVSSNNPYENEDYFSRNPRSSLRGHGNLPAATNSNLKAHFGPSNKDIDRPLVFSNAVTSNKLRQGSLQRTKSDVGPQHRKGAKMAVEEEEESQSPIRHGWDNEYYSTEYLSYLNSNYFIYFTEARHDNNGSKVTKKGDNFPRDWRMRDRMKTVSAALAICLNIGVDPPDVIKTNPTAKLEAWTDPVANTGGSKVMETIGKRLQEQYESLSLRTRYKQYLDPSIDETKRFATSLRKNAKDERTLFHYNGHGVPLPTASGELWVFNKTYTQYMPISLYDLQTWLGGPSLFVYDVSHAGDILCNFDAFVEKHNKENEDALARDPKAQVQNYNDCIQLAACDRNEMLPTNPDLPADLFTCCLTTPIDIALRWFVLQNPLECPIIIDDNKIPVPGRLQDRRSPLGELNWIFTAITDTIAWNTLDRPLFKKLFRQDLMVAALFRNFLLAERIMRANHCRPLSSPELPETHHHPLWQSWDLALEMVIRQMPMLIRHEKGEIQYEYQHSDFFAQQLTAFEVYLNTGPSEDKPPDQLPIVLQVLLSQVHRLRALILLSKFLDLGPWAVHLALSIGIFPYVVKLLQAASIELKPVMVFIWTRIMAVDSSVQSDLMKDNGVQYFIGIMNPNSDIPVGNASEHRAMCAFIITCFCKDYPHGQTVCLHSDLMSSCISNMNDPENPLTRQWSCLCLSTLWNDFAEAKWQAIRIQAHLRLMERSVDPVPEVRAAMILAFTTFIGIPDLTDQVEAIEEQIAAQISSMTGDGSALVRKELVIFWSTFVKRYENKFLVAAYESLLEERDRHPDSGNLINGLSALQLSGHSYSNDTIYGTVWTQVLMLSVDPHQEIAFLASSIVDYVYNALLSSPMQDLASIVIADLGKSSRKSTASVRKVPSMEVINPVASSRPSTPPPQIERQQSYISLSIKRTASTLRNFVTMAPPEKPPLDSAAHKEHAPTTPRGRIPSDWAPPAPPVNSSQTAPTPPSAGFDPASATRSSLPFKSTLIPWSTEYYREPQMRPNDADEPGSTDYNNRLYRRTRNERIIADNQPLKSTAATSKWTQLDGFLSNATQPTSLTFHQFDTHLSVADDTNLISIFDTTTSTQINRFSNSNPPGTRICDTKFLNEDDNPLLLTGSSDGVCKIYRHYTDPKQIYQITSFRALDDLVPSTKNAGLVFEWQQGKGSLLCAGDQKVIRVWSAASELCITDIPARSGSCVSSLTSDQLSGNIFVAGFGDGVVRVYDQRLNPRTAMVKAWREHKQWIQGVHMQRGGIRELISGSRNGEVKIWDIRMDTSIYTLDTLSNSPSQQNRSSNNNNNSDSSHAQHRENTTNTPPTTSNKSDTTLRTIALHEHAPVFTVGTDRHEVRTYNTAGEHLGTFHPLTSANSSTWAGRAGQSAVAVGHAVANAATGRGRGYRKDAIVKVAFHPHKMVLGCASWGDGHINLVTY